jgi:hypothetical protein
MTKQIIIRLFLEINVLSGLQRGSPDKNKAVYDTLYNNELFLNSTKFTPEEEKLFSGNKLVFYNRFKLLQ